MNVYCYFEPIFPEEISLLILWSESWKKHGWEPVILNQDNLPVWLSKRFDFCVSELPTVNHLQFERAAYRRHLAMCSVGGGFLTDYDVINYGFRPEHLPVNPLGPIPWGPFIGTGDQFWEFVRRIMTWNPSDCVMVDGKPHVSDIVIWEKLTTNNLRLDAVYGSQGWETSPLVHYSNHWLPPEHRGQKRLDFIRNARV